MVSLVAPSNSSFRSIRFNILNEVFSYSDLETRCKSVTVNQKWSKRALAPLYIGIVGYYALNFRWLPKVLDAIKEKDDPFSKELIAIIRENSQTAKVKNITETRKNSAEARIKLWTKLSKNNPVAQEIVSKAKTALEALNVQTQKYRCDPFLVQDYVDRILGIPKNILFASKILHV